MQGETEQRRTCSMKCTDTCNTSRSSRTDGSIINSSDATRAPHSTNHSLSASELGPTPALNDGWGSVEKIERRTADTATEPGSEGEDRRGHIEGLGEGCAGGSSLAW
jgi:hypothetical protein